MKGTLDQQFINELKERIEIHHTLLKAVVDMTACENRFYNTGRDLFTPIRQEAEDQLSENGDCIYDLLNMLYDEWSGIDDLYAKYGTRYPEPDELRMELYEQQDAITAEHDEVAGVIEYFEIDGDYKTVHLPMDFMNEVIAQIPNFVVNDDELGIL